MPDFLNTLSTLKTVANAIFLACAIAVGLGLAVRIATGIMGLGCPA